MPFWRHVSESACVGDLIGPFEVMEIRRMVPPSVLLHNRWFRESFSKRSSEVQARMRLWNAASDLELRSEERVPFARLE